MQVGYLVVFMPQFLRRMEHVAWFTEITLEGLLEPLSSYSFIVETLRCSKFMPSVKLLVGSKLYNLTISLLSQIVLLLLRLLMVESFLILIMDC